MTSKPIILFDVDGTLTDPRKLIAPETITYLASIQDHATLGVVGGSDLKKITEQLTPDAMGLFHYVFAENGLDAYVDGKTLRLIIGRFRPDMSPKEANLTLRIPSHPWVLSLSAAPLAVVAADLLASSDSRTARAAREWLRKFIRG